MDAYHIFEKSYQKINSAQTMEYYNISKERVNGTFFKDKSLVKVNRSPLKVYLFQKKEGGAEILYNSTVNKEKAIVNPRRFPFINLRLYPYGSTMRKNTHHTVFQADIKYTYDIVNYAIQKRLSNTLLKLIGKYKIGDKILYKLELINKNYRKYTYTVKKGEDLVQIGEKKRVGSFKILELNPNIPFYDKVSPGSKILIPNYYSKSITLYIDTQTFLPYMIKVYDEKGLYESYIFENLKINVSFSKGEFLESCKKYGF